MAIEMHVPNKSYDGYYGGVRFHKGVGVFEDESMAEDLAKRYSYELVKVDGETESEVSVEAEVEAEDVEKPAPKKKSRKKASPKAGE
ncbi:hypothetical protein [Bacillus altitudinis]|uniref:hypothetical protein n=1 Tax=Bacillus altitudinis TaxID=293387 RepID=UPI002101ADD4|nr:hypothetical protein [Bacillus altitudinis]UTV34872.1 hypothetical protein NM966_19980 [Bacillus altitudinis]